MALVHRAKLTHYFAPSAQHLGDFFQSLTSLYAEQQHTDLVLVAGGVDKSGDDMEDEDEAPQAAVFGSHQVGIHIKAAVIMPLIGRG